MSGFEAIENMINSVIKTKVDALDFNSIFSSQITPKLKVTVDTGIESLFKSYPFQEKAANMFNADLFKVYDDALTDCAVVKKIIDDKNSDTTAAFAVFIDEIQKAEKNDTNIKNAKTTFITKMTEISKKLGGGSPELKRSFKDQANKIGAMPTSQATAVGGKDLIEVLKQIEQKIKGASNNRESKINELRRSITGGKSKKTQGGKSKKRKRTNKRR